MTLTLNNQLFNNIKNYLLAIVLSYRNIYNFLGNINSLSTT